MFMWNFAQSTRSLGFLRSRMQYQIPDSNNPNLFSILIPRFLLAARVEFGFSLETKVKYGECLNHTLRFLGDREICFYGKVDLLRLRQWFLEKGLGASRQMVLLLAFKRFLRYCQAEKIPIAIDPETITPPRRPKREVVFLNTEELERFLDVIPLTRGDGEAMSSGLRFRTLVEVLMGTGMRISEALSLDRDKIDFTRREARIIGKGNKERVVFFTDRALAWIRRYLESRNDGHQAVFICQNGRERLKRTDIWRFFARYRKYAGISKRVTPHILRHTAATHLLFNGCPVSHIKEILGHERLETTCRYYLGLDKTAAKAAHAKYLVYKT